MKQLNTYDNYYIDRDGKLHKQNKRGNTRMLVGHIGQDGYVKYTLSSTVYGQKTVKAHRLVAEYYIQNNENKAVVDHIDGNKLNNTVDNLRWCTDEDNQGYRDEQGNCGKKYGIRGLDNTPLRIKYGDDIFDSKNKLAKHIAGISGSTVKCTIKTITSALKRQGTVYGKVVRVINE